MALFTVLDLLLEDDDMLFQLRRKKSIDFLCTLISLSFQRREWVPRIEGYAEHTIPLYSDFDFKYAFRIRRSVFDILLNALYDSLHITHTVGRMPIEPEKQLLVFLSYIGQQESMREVSNMYNISISTTHKIISRVAYIISTQLRNIVRWPDAAERTRIAQEIQLSSGLWGVVGFLDGTHIRLAAPIGGDVDYINRKKFPSIQLQVIVDHTMLIRSAYCGWPGCAHDARVLRNSRLYTDANGGGLFSQNEHLLGDSAYPLHQWLITPFRDNGHLNALQRRFNRLVSGQRQTVERAIGHLKGRFRRLREIYTHDPCAVCHIITSACILHNLCILENDDIENYIQTDPDIINLNGHVNAHDNVYHNQRAGVERRENLLNWLP